LLLQYLETVSHARSVGDFADAACVLSNGQLELSSRQVSELVTLAQKTTIIALDAGSVAPTPPRPIPERPDEAPLPGPGGPRTPYPVNDPGIADPGKPGSEPDYMPSPLPGVDPPAISKATNAPLVAGQWPIPAIDDDLHLETRRDRP
jgi:hypothetical protein